MKPALAFKPAVAAEPTAGSGGPGSSSCPLLHTSLPLQLEWLADDQNHADEKVVCRNCFAYSTPQSGLERITAINQRIVAGLVSLHSLGKFSDTG